MNGKIKWIEASMKAYDLVLKAREEARKEIEQREGNNERRRG